MQGETEPGSADPQFWDPRPFRRRVDKPRTPKPGVRATPVCELGTSRPKIGHSSWKVGLVLTVIL